MIYFNWISVALLLFHKEYQFWKAKLLGRGLMFCQYVHFQFQDATQIAFASDNTYTYSSVQNLSTVLFFYIEKGQSVSYTV